MTTTDGRDGRDTCAEPKKHVAPTNADRCRNIRRELFMSLRGPRPGRFLIGGILFLTPTSSRRGLAWPLLSANRKQFDFDQRVIQGQCRRRLGGRKNHGIQNSHRFGSDLGRISTVKEFLRGLRTGCQYRYVALSRLGQREQEGTGGYAGEPFGIGSPNNKGAEFQDAGA